MIDLIKLREGIAKCNRTNWMIEVSSSVYGFSSDNYEDADVYGIIEWLDEECVKGNVQSYEVYMYCESHRPSGLMLVTNNQVLGILEAKGL